MIENDESQALSFDWCPSKAEYYKLLQLKSRIDFRLFRKRITSRSSQTHLFILQLPLNFSFQSAFNTTTPYASLVRRAPSPSSQSHQHSRATAIVSAKRNHNHCLITIFSVVVLSLSMKHCPVCQASFVWYRSLTSFATTDYCAWTLEVAFVWCQE